MPSISDSKKLLDLCEFIIDCEHKTASTQEIGYPSIRTPNIGKGRLVLEGVNLVSEEVYRDWTKRAVPVENDLVLAREAPAGNVAILPKEPKVCLGQRTVLIRPNKKQVEPKYLVYLLLSDFMQHRLLSFSGGATVAHVNMKDIRALKMPTLPKIDEQRTIGSILSAYDDLIENNIRRIKILEEMAQRTYHEWFVEFNAPGIELRKATPEEKKVTGKDVFPEGWEVGIVNDLLSLKSGFAFKSVKFTDNGRYGLVTIKNVQDGVFNLETTSRLDELPENMPDYCLIESGDILMSLTGNIGRVCLTYGSNLVLNQRVSKIAPLRAEDKAISYCLFRQPEMQRKLEMIANGVAQQNLSPVETGRLAIAIPTKIIRDEFHKIVQSSLEMIVQLYQTNFNLRQTRDLLLPKLISGEVEV
jgi:type I restriction enzyme S subunit